MEIDMNMYAPHSLHHYLVPHKWNGTHHFRTFVWEFHFKSSTVLHTEVCNLGLPTSWVIKKVFVFNTISTVPTDVVATILVSTLY